jgi:hypothetical protein
MVATVKTTIVFVSGRNRLIMRGAGNLEAAFSSVIPVSFLAQAPLPKAERPLHGAISPMTHNEK